MNPTALFEREFPELRALLLQLAAALDRIERGKASEDARMAKVHRALEVLSTSGSRRAEQIQLVFSRDYSPEWKKELAL
jgi:hypothetical protein